MPRPASLRCWPTPTRARPRDYTELRWDVVIRRPPGIHAGGNPGLTGAMAMTTTQRKLVLPLAFMPGGLPHLPPSRWLASSPTFHRDYPWHSCREATNSNNLVQVSITRLTSPLIHGKLVPSSPATTPRQHLDNRILPHALPPAPTCNRSHGSVEATTIRPNRAAFAAHLATSCQIIARSLPFLAAFATHNAKRQVVATCKAA